LQLAREAERQGGVEPKCESWRFADGKAVEFYEYFDTAQVAMAMA
jgi:hypothetical protein